MKNKTELKLGFLLVAIVAIGYWGVNFMLGKDIFGNENEFYAKYKNLNGLKVGAPVQIKGYKVGQVREIKFSDEFQSALVVKFVVKSEYPISSKTQAKIFSADLMGTKAIELLTEESDSLFKSGDTLPAVEEQNLFDQITAEMIPIKAEAQKLMGSMTGAIKVISDVFNESTVKNLQKSFSQLNNVIRNVETSTSSLSTIMDPDKGRVSLILGNVESISSNLKQNNEKITTVLNNFASISDTLAQANIAETIKNTNESMVQLDSILNQINSGNGTLGKLVHNDTLYYNLEDASKSLDNLIVDLKENPSRYVSVSVFGGNKDKKNKKKNNDEAKQGE